MNTSAIVKTQSARRRRRDNNTGKPRDAHAPSTPTCQRAADEIQVFAGVQDRSAIVRRLSRGQAEAIHAERNRARTVDIENPRRMTAVDNNQRHAAAFLDDATYLDDIEPVPNPFTGHLLNLTAGPGRGRIDVRHRSGPT